MRKSLRNAAIGAFVAAGMIATGSAQAQPACGNPTTAILWAGQTIDAGSVTVWNDATSIYVRYSTVAPWVITESHLAVASSLDGIPQNRNGNPIPGHFPYSTVHNPGVTDFIYVIPLSGFSFGETLYVAAHAVVQASGGGGGGSQTAWAGNQGFPGRNWALYFTFQVQTCGPE